MKQNTKNLKNLLFAAAASLGLTAFAVAQDPMKAPPNPAEPTNYGLLGSTYAGVAWNYYRLSDGPPSAARGLTADFNQPLADDLDFGVGYDWLRTRAAGFSTSEEKLDLSTTTYARTDWGKPFLTAGVDHAWRDGDFAGRSGSWGLEAETGIEFQAAPALAVGPLAGWERETGFNRNILHYGARTTYRMSREWSATTALQWLDEKRDTDRAEFTLGVNRHF